MTVRTAVFTCVVLAASFSAQAQDAAINNACWGDIASDFAQVETGLIGQIRAMNDHAAPAGARDGVGNVSKGFSNEGTLSEGAPGDHAIAIGESIGLECDQF